MFKWRLLNQHGAVAVRARVTVLWRRGAEEEGEPDPTGNSGVREVFI
jgi:hypothetical protein